MNVRYRLQVVIERRVDEDSDWIEDWEPVTVASNLNNDRMETILQLLDQVDPQEDEGDEEDEDE